ncbi:unnamed protein product [Urochloa humidicola]
MLQLVHRLAHHGLCRTLVNTRRHDRSTAATPQLSPFRGAAISGGFNEDGRRHARQLVPAATSNPSGGPRRERERKKTSSCSVLQWTSQFTRLLACFPW